MDLISWISVAACFPRMDRLAHEVVCKANESYGRQVLFLLGPYVSDVKGALHMEFIHVA